MNLTERVKHRALELGFDLIGIAPAGPATRAEAYARWVEAGHAGEMAYMARDPGRRADSRLALDGARSVVVVGLSHYTIDLLDEIGRDPSRGLIARYAWGIDYHDLMMPRLRRLLAFIRGECGREIQARTYVDTGPLLERDIAEQAGLGFTGKNTCLIHPRMGSWLFLGEIAIDLELDYDRPLHGIGCGICTRCLSACPTDAFSAPYILDARRCISYLTIELKGVVPRHLRKAMGNRIFGCDDCQDVCPWPRRFARPTRETGFYPIDVDRAAPRLLDLIGLSSQQFTQRFKGTPIMRARRRGLLRNVCVALGNWADPDTLPALAGALNDEEPLIRAHAAWAMGETKTPAVRRALESRYEVEHDPAVLDEIIAAAH